MPITAYAAVDPDVQGINIHRTYSSSTKPTTTQVEAALEDGYREINARLSALGYTMPFTSTTSQSYKILKLINAYFAAAQAEMFAASFGGPAEAMRGQALLKEYERRMALIEDGSQTLIDATEGRETPAQRNEQTPVGTFNLDSNDDERDSVFTRDMKF